MVVMNSLDKDPFCFQNLNSLAEACIDYYSSYLAKSKEKAPDFRERRVQLSRYIRKFHKECGTLNPNVEAALEKLEDGSCIFLMTAHQPNLFAYGGVLRKATLNQVLAEKLSKTLRTPVVTFFGIADQDFTDDRWVKSALLPDVERRQGILELRFRTPEKVMLNKVGKPSRKILDDWQAKIKHWYARKLKSIERLCNPFGVKFVMPIGCLTGNFENFWSVVEEAYAMAENYSDFNAFVMSRIINDVWGYNTLFSRFSECQQIFEKEFCFLLTNFDEYSKALEELTLSPEKTEGGVFEDEFRTIPFWYHCDCGGKARLTAERNGESISGFGKCLHCEREYKLDFDSTKNPEISGILSKISARSLSMPIIFFEGLGVCCYVGGAGGKEYLRQAKVVAERLGTAFPPVVVWRPKDVYHGASQVEALLTYAKFSNTLDFSKYPEILADFKRKVSEIKEKIVKLELRKQSLLVDKTVSKEDKTEKVKAISLGQTMIRKETHFSILVRELKLLENINAVMRLHPCIIDYAVNVGLKPTSEQWITFINENGNLLSDVHLKTIFDELFHLIESKVNAK
jgi:hypothetical protein